MGDSEQARPTHVHHVGDCDPPGMFFPERIVELGTMWALRWWCERKIWENLPNAPRRLRWNHACRWADDLVASGNRTITISGERLIVPTFTIVVHRVAVTYADLNQSRATSTVSAAVAKQYARWWKPGERRTLQVEGLAISAVADRVGKSLDRHFDSDLLDSVKADEKAAHATALSLIRRQPPERRRSGRAARVTMNRNTVERRKVDRSGDDA